MDSVSIVLVTLLGAAVVWLVVRAFRNARHDPPTKVRGGLHAAGGSDSTVASRGAWRDPEVPGPPRSRRPGDQSR